MREKVSTLRLDALSKNGRAYAAAVAVIVALFLLLTVSFQGSDSTQLTGIPSRFLFSTGAFSSPPSVTLSLSVQCSLSEWVSRTQQGFHLTRSNSVAIAHSLPVVAFHVYVCGAYGSGKQLASCKHPQVRVLLEKVTTSQDARSAETMQKRYTLSATCIILRRVSMSAGRALLFLICSAGVVLRNHPSSNRNSKALAALACNRHHNAHISFLGVLSEAGQAIKQKDPCDSLPPGTKCFHDMKVWQPSLASVSQCLLKRPIVYVNENTRLQCDQMRRVDPSVVQVDQSHCYPDEYFTAIPSAAYLLERYPNQLAAKVYRPGRTTAGA